MKNQTTTIEAVFVRHGWKVFFVVSVIFGIFGFGDLFLGMDADPAIVESITGVAWEETQSVNPDVAHVIDMQVRAGGAQLIVVSVITIVVCLIGYRRGQRWAWVALWVFPLWMASIFVLFLLADRKSDMPAPPPMVSAPIFLTVTMLTLLLTYRHFFSKHDDMPGQSINDSEVIS